MSERLSDGTVELRPWRDEDAADLVDCLDGDEEITRWLDQIPQPYRLEHALAYVRGEVTPDEERWCVSDGRVLGSIGISPRGDGVFEIGYWVRADARGRGYTSRALVLLSHDAIATGAARVFLRADPENVASCRVAEKAGFTREGVLRSAHWNARLGRRQDWAIYALVPGDEVGSRV